MIKCIRCGTENFDTSQYCDECGSRLKRTEISDLSNDAEKESKAGIYQVESIISGASRIKEVSGESARAKMPRAKLTIERGKSAGKEFVSNADEINIGRWDADNGIFPDVDLDADDPEAKVSRRHARILREGGQFWLEDLGSTNGTFINRGRRLLPGNRQVLQDGDEIIVGKTFLRFQIV